MKYLFFNIYYALVKVFNLLISILSLFIFGIASIFVMVWEFSFSKGVKFLEDGFLSPPYLRNFSKSYISDIRNYDDEYTYIWKNEIRYYLGLKHDYIIENSLLDEKSLYYDCKSNYFIRIFDNSTIKNESDFELNLDLMSVFDTGFSKSMQTYVPVGKEFKKGLITTHEDDECRINPSKHYIDVYCKDLYGIWYKESKKFIIKIKSRHIKN